MLTTCELQSSLSGLFKTPLIKNVVAASYLQERFSKIDKYCKIARIR